MGKEPVQIVAFQSRHAADWAQLNRDWLAEGGFALEARDRQMLDDPETVIIGAGGRIFIAEKEGRSVGCCALLPMADGGLELAKMTVTPAARGRNVSRRLIEAAEAVARAQGAPRLYLECNSALAPALALYRSVGFVDLPARQTPYARVDVFMQKSLGG